jgi:NAD/NADP transhydrogenase beta subunit
MCIVPGGIGAFPLNSETGSADDDDDGDDRSCTSGEEVCRILADEPAVVVINGMELSVTDVDATVAEATAQKELVGEDVTTLLQFPESDFSGDLEIFCGSSTAFRISFTCK